MQGPEFAQLKAFITVVEEGGFSKAAKTLGRSRSALSQSIRTLEERLGVLLLNRTTRSVALTSAGERLFADVRPAMSSLDKALTGLVDSDQIPSGTVRLHTQKLGYKKFVAPHIASFRRLHPKISVDICVNDDDIDIVSAGFDAGLTLGELLDEDMVSLKLGADL